MIKTQKIFSIFLLLFIFYFLFPGFAYSKNIDLYFFWGSGCPHCANMAQVLKEVSAQYSELKINTFEVWNNPNNQRLLLAMAKGYNFTPEGVPVIFIGEHVFEGDGQNEVVQLQEAIRSCSISECISPIEKVDVNENKIKLKWGNIGILAGVVIFIFLMISLLKKKK